MGGEEAPRTCKQNPGGKESGRVPVLLLPITSRAVGTWGTMALVVVVEPKMGTERLVGTLAVDYHCTRKTTLC